MRARFTADESFGPGVLVDFVFGDVEAFGVIAEALESELSLFRSIRLCRDAVDADELDIDIMFIDAASQCSYHSGIGHGTRSKVDVIVTWYTPPATAAKQATREIPMNVSTPSGYLHGRPDSSSGLKLDPEQALTS